MFEKSSSTNWIFNLQKLILKLIFAGYKGSKNPVRNRLNIQFFELDFSSLIFQKSSTDQQEVGVVAPSSTYLITDLYLRLLGRSENAVDKIIQC